VIPHHALPTLAERQLHDCDACGLPITWGYAFVVRGIRRKLRWHVACDPAPRCPLCGVLTDDAWGCMIHRAIAAEVERLAGALSARWHPAPTEERVRHLFRDMTPPAMPERV